MFGGLAERAIAFAGPLSYQHKQLKGDLKIMQWAHFVPAYDKWLDNTYVKQWGEKNDVEVKIDHINNALLPSDGRLGGGGAERTRPLPVPLPAVGAREADDPAERHRPGGHEEAREDDGRRLQVDATTRRRRSTSASPTTTSRTRSTTGKSIWFNVGDRPEHVGQRPQGGAEAEEGRPSGRARHVERARLEHDADVAPLLLRRVAPERRTAGRRSTARARSRP